MMRPGKQIKSVSTMLARRMQAISRSRQLDDMTGIISWIIAFLSENTDKPVYQKDIERCFGLRSPSVTGMLKQLEAKGLILRETESGDARLKRIVLTDAAKGIEEQIHGCIFGMEDAISDCLTETERQELQMILGKIIEELKRKDREE